MRIFANWLKRLSDIAKNRLVVSINYFKYGSYIKKELKNCPQNKLSKKQVNDIKSYFKSYGLIKIRTFWHQFYGGYYNEVSNYFIPQDLFFSHIERALNDENYKRLQDKNILESIFNEVLHLKTIIKSINGFYQKEGVIISKKEAIEFLTEYDRFIIKPSFGHCGGSNIEVVNLKELSPIDRKKLVEDNLDSHDYDFVIQEFLNQSRTMNKLNSSSLNTIRICSYLNKDGVHILFSVVRFGSAGSFLDNISKGGYYCPINEDGSLQKKAYNTWREVLTTSQDGAKLENFIIPNYDIINDKIIKLHQQVPFFKLVSWDIAINTDDFPVLVEFNAFGQSIDFQAVTGPLFQEHTNEVLEITKKYLAN